MAFSGTLHVQVVSNGYLLYIIGGIENYDTVCVATLYSYDPVQQNFTALAPMPEANCRGGAAVLDDKIYVTAGFNSASQTGTLPCLMTGNLLCFSVLNFLVSICTYNER